jgi:hypothetical protein
VLTQIPKDFQPTYDVFNENALTQQYSIAGFLFLAQWLKFAAPG